MVSLCIVTEYTSCHTTYKTFAFQPEGVHLSFYLTPRDGDWASHLTSLQTSAAEPPLSAVTIQAVASLCSSTVRVLTPDGVQHVIHPFPGPDSTSAPPLHLGHIVGTTFLVLHGMYPVVLP